MVRRSRANWIFNLAAGLLLSALSVTAISVLPVWLDSTNRELVQIRRLAEAGDPRLPRMLDERMVTGPAGTFLMGSEAGQSNEHPQRTVYLDAYQIDRYEVTNLQYQQFVAATQARAPRYWSDGRYPAGLADAPVVGVSWEESAAYCEWAGERLPTEAEWEKACRGTDGRTYPWGDDWDASRANVGRPFTEARAGVWDEAWTFLTVKPRSSTMPSLRPIGTYPSGASPFGVMDMVGNAAEWVADWYNWSDYSALPDRNPQGSGPQWNHSLRGSSWYLPYGDLLEAQDRSRCSRRDASHAGDSDARLGFRCARTIP